MNEALDIIGQTFDHTADGTPTQQGWDELTKALSIYSDKRYETARYLFIKDGKIARHVAVSSRQPSETIARPDDNFLYTLQDYAERTQSSVVFVHNHPSGHIVPSDADIKLTSMLENVFTDRNGEKHLLGHAILDHGNFGLYTPQSGWKALIDGKVTELYEAEQAHNEETSDAMQIRTDTDLMDVAEYVKQLDAGTAWDKTRWVHSVLADITGTITTHELIGIDEFAYPDTLIRKLKDVGREYGSPSIYLFPTDSTQHLICERFAEDTKAVRDVYYEKEQGGFELSQFSGGSLFSRITAEDITVEDTNMLDADAVKERMERGGADAVALKDMAAIANALETQTSILIPNDSLGNVVYDSGTFGDLSKKRNGGFGMKHMIQGRYQKDGLTEEQISAVLYLVAKVTRETKLSKEETSRNRIIIEKDGIQAVLSKHWYGGNETWIVTGYPINNQDNQMTKEAMDAIQTVIATYSYAPEFSSVRKQVGAITKSIDSITQSLEKSSKKDLSDTQSRKTAHEKIGATSAMQPNNRREQNMNRQQGMLGAYIYKAHPDAVAAAIRGDIDGVLASNIKARMQDQSIHNMAQIDNEIGRLFYNDSVMRDESMLYGAWRHGRNSQEFKDTWVRFVRRNHGADIMDMDDLFSRITNTDRDALEKENFKAYENTFNEMHNDTSTVEIDGKQYVELSEFRKLQTQVNMLSRALNKKQEIPQEEPSQTIEKSNEMPPAQEEGKSQYEGSDVYAFSRATALRKGTVVPDFGSYNPDTKKIELLHGFRFEAAQVAVLNTDGSEAKDKDSKTVYANARDDDLHKTILLSKIGDDGKRIERRISEQQYQQMIDTQERFETERKNTAENTFEWTQLHDDYAREMEIDLDKPRLNTWENFIHNFQLRCRLYAHNTDDAMRQAKFLVDDMTPQQRVRFNQRLRCYGKEKFNNLLKAKYAEIKDEERIDEFYFTTEDQGIQNDWLSSVAKTDREQKPGTAIADTHFKVGDIIPMSFSTKGFDTDDKTESPVNDYQIAKVSKGFRPERAILYSKDAKSMYCVPLPDLLTYLQKYEQTRKNKREHTKQDYVFTTEKEKVQEKKALLKMTQRTAKNATRTMKDKYYEKHYEGR